MQNIFVVSLWRVTLARATTFAIHGLDAHRITVEVDLRRGLPAFTIVGCPDPALKEARERVVAALLNQGFELPPKRITVNLAPAEIPKRGPSFDLAIACALLAASGQISLAALERRVFYAELALTGALLPSTGVLITAEAAHKQRFKDIVIAEDAFHEADLVEGLTAVPGQALSDVVAYLRGEERAKRGVVNRRREPEQKKAVDFADVQGHHVALRALEIAAAGGHNILMVGSPGIGKTMIAQRIATILPPLAQQQAQEVARIRSVIGEASTALNFEEPPFRSPHHTISSAGLLGGGSYPRPGEITLAHHGVLFLDELAEFSRSALEGLRQPLEDQKITIVRKTAALTFPAAFMLVAAVNPCPCGYAGTDRCRCSEVDLIRYQRKLRSPLIDRIDMTVSLARPEKIIFHNEPHHNSYGSSVQMRERVCQAREQQGKRGGMLNARLQIHDWRHAQLFTSAVHKRISEIYERGVVSARAAVRLLRVARTIADLEAKELADEPHLLEAFSFRQEAATP